MSSHFLPTPQKFWKILMKDLLIQKFYMALLPNEIPESYDLRSDPISLPRLVKRLQHLTGVQLTKEALIEFEVLWFLLLLRVFLLFNLFHSTEITGIKNCSSRYRKSESQSQAYEYYVHSRSHCPFHLRKKKPRGTPSVLFSILPFIHPFSQRNRND